jgi:hypothetical protein
VQPSQSTHGKKITPSASPRRGKKKSETGPRIQDARQKSRKSLKMPDILKSRVSLSEDQLKALGEGLLLESDLKEGQLREYKKFERKVTERLPPLSPRRSPREEASARQPSPVSVKKLRGETLEVFGGSEEQAPLTPRGKSSPRIKPQCETSRVIPKQVRASRAGLNEPLHARLGQKIDYQRKKIDGLKQQLRAEEGHLSLLQLKLDALAAKASGDASSSADSSEFVDELTRQPRRRQQ